MNLFSKIWDDLFGEKPKRIYLKDVKPGEKVVIEWHRIKGRIGELKCLNNDPVKKKILLEVQWRNFEKAECDEDEKLLLDYNSLELKDFHLLNEQHRINASRNIEQEYLAILKQNLHSAVENEKFEEADVIKKKIEILEKG